MCTEHTYKNCAASVLHLSRAAIFFFIFLSLTLSETFFSIKLLKQNIYRLLFYQSFLFLSFFDSVHFSSTNLIKNYFDEFPSTRIPKTLMIQFRYNLSKKFSIFTMVYVDFHFSENRVTSYAWEIQLF